MTPTETPGFSADLPDRADVVVVGGGIAGASTALHLARSGVDVVLLERHAVGRGATDTAVGVLLPPMRQPFHETVRFRGQATALRIWEFALRSVADLAAELERMGVAEETGLDLAGGYVLAESHTLAEVKLCHGTLESAGLPVRWLTGDEVHRLVGAPGLPGGYVIEGGGALSPGITAVALARAAVQAGARIVEGADVRDVERAGGAFLCRTEGGDVIAEMVVYATHVSSRRFSPFLGDEIVPIRGQGMRASRGAPRFRGSFTTHQRRNMWRTAPDGSLLLGGWRPDAWDRSYWRVQPALDDSLQVDVQRWFETTLRQGEPLEVDHRWSGIFGWTADHLPLVGPLPGRVGELVVSGFSGGGLPFAYASGRVIASIVAEGDPVPGGELLNPRRFT